MWLRGNLHTHTTGSDGNRPPEEACAIYRSLGYEFLAITDHKTYTSVSPARSHGLVMIPGIELGTHALNAQGRPLHVCAWGVEKQLSMQALAGVTETLQAVIDTIVQEGGVAQVNHPNWHWALSADDLMPLRDCHFLEIINTSSGCQDEGDEHHVSVETTWDRLLMAGQRWYATAVDDTHNYDPDKRGTPDAPGQGWVVVDASARTPSAILRALQAGRFYASTGVTLSQFRASGLTMSLTVGGPQAHDALIQFISDGQIVQETRGHSAKARCPRNARYMRARITLPDGSRGWTQPVFRKV